MLKRYLLLLFFIPLLFPHPAFAQDESVTFTTYYPSPYGDYNNLTTNNFIARENVTLATESGSKVGIGMTVPPFSVLNVAGNQANAGSDNLAQIMVIGGNGNTNARLLLGYDTTNSKGYIQAVHNALEYKPLLLNPNGGNVGIGTTSPNISAWGSSQGLDIKGSPGGVLSLRSGSLNPWQMGAYSDGNFYMAYGGTTVDHRLVITAAGNVGIGTTAPGEKKLKVQGDIEVTGTIYGNIPWSSISSRPAGLDDGDQVGIPYACGWSGWRDSPTLDLNTPCPNRIFIRMFCSGGVITDFALSRVPDGCA